MDMYNVMLYYMVCRADSSDSSEDSGDEGVAEGEAEEEEEVYRAAATYYARNVN